MGGYIGGDGGARGADGLDGDLASNFPGGKSATPSPAQKFSTPLLPRLELLLLLAAVAAAPGRFTGVKAGNAAADDDDDGGARAADIDVLTAGATGGRPPPTPAPLALAPGAPQLPPRSFMFMVSATALAEDWPARKCELASAERSRTCCCKEATWAPNAWLKWARRSFAADASAACLAAAAIASASLIPRTPNPLDVGGGAAAAGAAAEGVPLV